MPTYAYRCDSCGEARDEWLKMSEAVAERVCPACGQSTFRKQLTAPAFQLKGSGWYATDFRNNGTKPAEKSAKEGAEPATNADAPVKTDVVAAESPAKPASTESSASTDKPAGAPPATTPSVSPPR